MRGNEARAAELETEAKKTSDAADIAQRCAHISFWQLVHVTQKECVPSASVQWQFSICYLLHRLLLFGESLKAFCRACSKKEVAWSAAMRAGEGADKQSDRGYLDATKAVGVPFFLDKFQHSRFHQLCASDSPEMLSWCLPKSHAPVGSWG